MSNFRIPLQVQDSTGDIQTVSGYIVALREYPFDTNTLMGVEAIEKQGYYDFDASLIIPNREYQLWAGTIESKLSRNLAFSNEEGRIIFGLDDTGILDANDFANDDLIKKNDLLGGFESYPLATLINDVASQIPSGGVNYWYVRATISQSQTIDSGKPFIGQIFFEVDPDTGDILSESKIPGIYEQTLATTINAANSARVSTGFYYLQFRVGSTNAFRSEIMAQTDRAYCFESKTYLVTRSHVPFDNNGTWQSRFETVPVGYLVFCPSSEPTTTYTELGRLPFKTFNLSWVLSDDILKGGCIIEVPYYPELSTIT
jgi:hypothetical protein